MKVDLMKQISRNKISQGIRFSNKDNTCTHKSQKYFLNLINTIFWVKYMDSRITQSTHLTYKLENYFSEIKYNVVI